MTSGVSISPLTIQRSCSRSIDFSGTPSSVRAPAPLQQVVVKLAAADTVADRLIIMILDDVPADQSGEESRDRLQRATGGIVTEVDLKRVHDLRGDPAGTRLVARELLTVKNQHVEPPRGEAARRMKSPPDHRQRSTRHTASLAALPVSPRSRRRPRSGSGSPEYM